MRTLCALATMAALTTGSAVWAAETDLENPNLRELPLRQSPISGGKQHQPTPAEISARIQGGGAGAPAPTTASPPQTHDDLYQRVLKQSQQGTPRVLDPGK